MDRQAINDTLAGLWLLIKILIPIALIFSTAFIHYVLPFIIICIIAVIALARMIGEQQRMNKDFDEWLQSHKEQLNEKDNH